MERNSTEWHYSLDSLSCRDGRLFGWGWFFSDIAQVSHINLRIDYEIGGSEEIHLAHGSMRSDVASAFPGSRLALNSGFVVCGRLRDNITIRAAWLDVNLAGSTQLVCALPNFPAAYILQTKRAQRWVGLLKRGLHAALAGDIAAFGRRAQPLVRKALRMPRVSMAAVVSRFSEQKWHVIFDHALGGGANRYRESWIEDAIVQSRNVALITPHLASLTYSLEMRQRIGTRKFVFDSERALLAKLDQLSIQDVVINNLVSFDSAQTIIFWAMQAKQRGASLVVMLHDFYFVCRSFTLLNDLRQYCGVPSLEICAACLSSNDAMFLSYESMRGQREWRALWWGLLQAADRVVAFSESTINIANRAYPELRTCRLEIVPHKIEYFPHRQIRVPKGASLVIGIVGSISFQKGAQIIREMVELIEQQRLSIRIVVVGTIEEAIHSPVFHQTGFYNNEDLTHILELERVTVGFLPSIIPETFSYVTSELMAVGLPLAVFDIGAPAERVREYNKGCVITEINASNALAEIIRLHKKMQPAPAHR
jgi:glycosyltransferase involved in cell wall biosynthesis